MSDHLHLTIAPKSAHPLNVYRLGYGTMRLTGPQIWGEPADRPQALQVLKRAVEKGVNFIDTADYYGEDITNRLIAEALYPYRNDLVICTKVGATRRPDKSWVPYNRPEELRKAIDNNLRTLKIEQVQLVHYRVMSHHSDVPFEEGMDAMFEMQKEGKILHVGVSNVSRSEMETAIKMGDIATVEQMYGHGQRSTITQQYGENRGGDEVLDICEAHGIPLVPYWSLVNSLPKGDNKIGEIAKKYSVSEAQINIAWLLHKSPLLLPIPGTSSLAHLEENLEAVNIRLTDDDMAYLR